MNEFESDVSEWESSDVDSETESGMVYNVDETKTGASDTAVPNKEASEITSNENDSDTNSDLLEMEATNNRCLMSNGIDETINAACLILYAIKAGINRAKVSMLFKMFQVCKIKQL
jgi:hypothetical protein